MKLTRAAVVWAIAAISGAGVVGGLLRSVGSGVTLPAALIPHPMNARPAPEPRSRWARPLHAGGRVAPSERDASLIDADEVTLRATLEPGIPDSDGEESVAADVENSDDADEITRLATLQPVLEPPVD
jgi:hypothetical protein